MTDVDEQGRLEPPLAGDEAATLLGFLDNGHADLIRESIDGLTGE
jgi:hypothetical protein